MPLNGREKRPYVADLSALLEALTDAEIEFIVVGGLAAVAQGAPITTIDLDIVHRQSHDNLENLLAFLQKVDAIHRRPDDKVLEPTVLDLAEHGHVLLSTRYGPLDVLAFIEEGLGYDDLLSDTIEIDFRGRKVRVLSLQKIVELKRNTSDPVERQRLVVLRETLRQLNENDSGDT